VTQASPFRRAIIVGASSGIGEALAIRLAGEGCRLALVSRRAETLNALAARINQPGAPPLAFAYPHDVRQADQVGELFQRIVADLGGLDLIVYSSGIMPTIATDEYSLDKDREIIEINLIGAVAWLNEAARRFEKIGAGAIVGISSVAADRGRRSNTVYAATKAALDTYLESLRNRIERYGATVITIKPGPVQTPMTAGLSMPFMITAEQAAREILDAIAEKKRVVYVPVKWRVIMGIVKAIPSPIFKWLSF